MSSWKNENSFGPQVRPETTVGSGLTVGFAFVASKILAQVPGCGLPITNQNLSAVFSCKVNGMLVKKSTEAARQVASGDGVLLASTFSSIGQFRNHKKSH
jgi:hypothetical protein